MVFDLAGLLAARRGEGYDLTSQYLNPQLPRMLHAIGFDRVYERAEGAYLYDTDGHRYADFLAGFGVFSVGRNHPVVRQALRDLLDAEPADLVQFDTPLLPGLLAEMLLAKAPGLDRVYFCNSGTEAVEAALKFARYATGRQRIVYCDHAFHGLTTGSLSINGDRKSTRLNSSHVEISYAVFCLKKQNDPRRHLGIYRYAQRGEDAHPRHPSPRPSVPRPHRGAGRLRRCRRQLTHPADLLGALTA